MENTLKENAYIAIKQKILSCEYAPNTMLSEDMLCTDLNISRTPVRDAISRLSQENLVRVISKKGIFVQGISIKDLNSIYEARLMMEPQIILRHGSSVNREYLMRLHEIFSDIDIYRITPTTYTETDMEFHSYIFSLADNVYYDQLYHSISDQNFRISILGGQVPIERRQRSLQEHLEMIELLMNGDLERAASEMEQHILLARESKYGLLVSRGSTFSL